MNIPPVYIGGLVLLLAVMGAHPLSAQSVGSLASERDRLAEITGDTAYRRAGAPELRLPRMDLRARLLLPEVRFTWNSEIPYSLNDGSLWAGRGKSASVTAGLEIEPEVRGVRRVRIAVAPAFVFSENLPFQIFSGTDTDRSAYANPFYPRQASADYPMRFGDRHLYSIEPGKSRAEISARGFVAGVTADHEWWGPAIRNTLILSNNARGIPRFYLGNDAPVRTRFGRVDARYIAGTLTESNFFDVDGSNDYRALSGVRLQLRAARDTNLAFGLARVVYSTTDKPVGPTIAHGADVFTRWQNIDTARAGTQNVDQLLSLFGRWVFPDVGFEVYAEWARMDNPQSVTELLAAAHHTAGYTVGFQWARARRAHSYLRLQSELTYLEQSTVFPDRPPPDFYSGRATQHGYTQRGQVIGAAIGPGGSSQFLAIDYLAPSWHAGWFVGRVRWNNDALYRKSGGNFLQHDATLLTGLRGAWRSPVSDLTAELTYGYRFNYLFQWGGHNPGGFRTVDVRNLTVALTASPR